MSDHNHKLRRGRYKTGTFYFKCVECPFVVTVTQAVGRVNRCWKCANPFMLNRNDIRWAKPVCPDCRNKPRQVTSTIDTALDQLLQ